MLLNQGWLPQGINARAMALGRVLCGLASALFLVELTPVITRMASGEVLRVPYALPAEVLTPTVGWTVLATWIAGTAGMLLGVLPRVSCLMVCVVAAFVVLLDAQTYSNHMYLFAILAGIFATSRCGEAYTIGGRTGRVVVEQESRDTHPRADRHTARAEPPEVSAFPAVLMVVMVGIVYTFAGLAKVNAAFLSGSVILAYLPRPIAVALAAMPSGSALLIAMAVSAVVLELALGIGFLIPRYRRDAFLIGFVLHVGMIASMQQGVLLELIGFAILMLSAYVPALALLGVSRDIVWDDNCSVCAEWVTSFQRLDWLGALRLHGNSDESVLERFELTRAQANASMWAFGGDGREAGFRAMIEILEQLPLTFAWARVLRLPPIAMVGDRWYRWYARRR